MSLNSFTKLYKRELTRLLVAADDTETRHMPQLVEAAVTLQMSVEQIVTLHHQLLADYMQEERDRAMVGTEVAVLLNEMIQAVMAADGHQVVFESASPRPLTELGNTFFEKEFFLNLQALESISMGMVVTDAQFGDQPVVYVNGAFCEMTGYPAHEIIGRNCRFLQGEGTNPEALARLREAINHQQGVTVMLRNYRKSGEPFWNELTISPIFDDSQQLRYFIGIQRDITRQIGTKEELKASLERERELNVMRTRFVSMASHEFRTPLTVIRSAAETLNKFYERLDDEQRQVRFSRINEQIEQLLALLDNMLAIGREDKAAVQLKPEIFPITRFISDICLSVGEAAPHHTLQTDFQAEDIKVKGDKGVLRELFMNLLSNAVKYSPDVDTVHVRLVATAVDIIFIVQDFGIGIPEADQFKLFDGFHRASNVGQIQGTGLGMVIIKRAVDLHHGSLEIQSAEEKGTTITVRLPIIIEGE